MNYSHQLTFQRIWAVVSFVLQIVITVICVLAVASILAGGQQPVGLHQTLQAVAGMVLTGALVSSLLEKFPWFQALARGAKETVVALFTFGSPIAAQLVLDMVPASVFAALDRYWILVALGAVGWLGSQGWHAIFNSRLSEERRFTFLSKN